MCLNLNSINIFQSKAEELHKTLGSPELTRATLDALMTNFVETAEAGTHSEAGWPSSTYFVSKIGWSALSRIQQREMAADPRADIVVNHVHPGYVDTDMTSHKGPLTIDRYYTRTNYSILSTAFWLPTLHCILHPPPVLQRRPVRGVRLAAAAQHGGAGRLPLARQHRARLGQRAPARLRLIQDTAVFGSIGFPDRDKSTNILKLRTLIFQDLI